MMVMVMVMMMMTMMMVMVMMVMVVVVHCGIETMLTREKVADGKLSLVVNNQLWGDRP